VKLHVERNPNVFQICAIRDIGTERERRQTIGRGVPLCVNQQGERLRGLPGATRRSAASSQAAGNRTGVERPAFFVPCRCSERYRVSRSPTGNWGSWGSWPVRTAGGSFEI
jgi:hypothetical protein